MKKDETKPVTITSFEVENVKKVKAVRHDCEMRPLTVIGGQNAQGKSSVLHAIAWAAGGDSFCPSNPLREGADELLAKVTFSNGVICERTGPEGKLKVTDPLGKKSGQTLLKSFVSQIALDLDEFMNANPTGKAKMLLDMFPEIGPELNKLNLELKRIYDERLVTGRVADQMRKYADGLPFDTTAPDELLTGSEMTAQMQAALLHNAKIRDFTDSVSDLERQIAASERKIADLTEQLERVVAARNEITAKLENTRTVLAGLVPENVDAIQTKLEEMDAINAKVRANLEKANATRKADEHEEQYTEATRKLESIRAKRLMLLSGVKLPLPELDISPSGTLIYRGQEWDGCSSAEQLKVAIAICAAMRPECGFVLIDGMERFDNVQLASLAEWLHERNLQVIGTRVSDGDECSIIIEDGEAISF